MFTNCLPSGQAESQKKGLFHKRADSCTAIALWNRRHGASPQRMLRAVTLPYRQGVRRFWRLSETHNATYAFRQVDSGLIFSEVSGSGQGDSR